MRIHTKTSRRTPVSVAKLQVRDLERAVARSNTFAARFWRIITDSARARKVHLLSGLRVRDFDEELVDKTIQELVDLMAYTYLLRRRLSNRRRSMSKDVSIYLSVSEDAKRIADQFDLDLGNIRARFETLAGKAVKKGLGDIRRTMNNELARVTREGITATEASDHILAAVRKHGVQPRKNGYIDSLVRTHSAIAYGAAHKASFVGDTDLWGFEYVTMRDDRVRPEHEELDGIRRRVGDPFWDIYWPPNGWNCRCQAVAIYEDVTQTREPYDVWPDEGFDFDPMEFL